LEISNLMLYDAIEVFYEFKNNAVHMKNNSPYDCRLHFEDSNHKSVSLLCSKKSNRIFQTKYDKIYVNKEEILMKNMVKIPYNSLQVYFDDKRNYFTYKYEYEKNQLFSKEEEKKEKIVETKINEKIIMKPSYVSKVEQNIITNPINALNKEEESKKYVDVDDPESWRINKEKDIEKNIDKKIKINNQNYNQNIQDIEHVRGKRILGLKKELLDIEYEFRMVGINLKYELLETGVLKIESNLKKSSSSEEKSR